MDWNRAKWERAACPYPAEMATVTSPRLGLHGAPWEPISKLHSSFGVERRVMAPPAGHMRNSRAPGRGWLTSLGVALSEQDDQYLGCSWWQCWWDTQVETSGWMLGLEPQTCTEETVAIPQTGMNEALGENPVGAEGQRGGKGQRRPRGRRWGGRCQVTEPSGDRWADSAGRMLPSKDTTWKDKEIEGRGLGNLRGAPPRLGF